MKKVQHEKSAPEGKYIVKTAKHRNRATRKKCNTKVEQDQQSIETEQIFEKRCKRRVYKNAQSDNGPSVNGPSYTGLDFFQNTFLNESNIMVAKKAPE